MILVILILIGGLFYIYRGSTEETDAARIPAPIENPGMPHLQEEVDGNESENKKERLIVDVKGAVRTPGVFEMQSGQRVNDVVQLAGGFSGDADQNSVNLAQVLEDEMVIYVAKIGEGAESIAAQEKEDGKVDINHANIAELETIPGIGPSKAGAIITYREENGGFSSIEELTNVAGIGQKTFEQMKEFITVSK